MTKSTLISLLTGFLLLQSTSFAAPIAQQNLQTQNVDQNEKNKIQASLNEIHAAQEQTQYLFNQVGTNEQKERLRYVNDRLTSAENILNILLNQNAPVPQPPPYQPAPQPNPPYQPVPQPQDNVELYRSDSCSGSLIGITNMTTDCQKFSNAAAVWGIKVNGSCINTYDMPAVKACETFKNVADTKAIKIYRADDCSHDLSSVITVTTDCRSLDNSLIAWGALVNGKCQNLNDTTPQNACNFLRASMSPNAIELYRSDTCTTNLVAYVDRYTSCSSLATAGQVWGIKVNGECKNIDDADAVTVCERFKP